jgi:hypothetical protein
MGCLNASVRYWSFEGNIGRTPVSIPLFTSHEVTSILEKELFDATIQHDGVQRTFGAWSDVLPSGVRITIWSFIRKDIDVVTPCGRPFLSRLEDQRVEDRAVTGEDAARY